MACISVLYSSVPCLLSSDGLDLKVWKYGCFFLLSPFCVSTIIADGRQKLSSLANFAFHGSNCLQGAEMSEDLRKYREVEMSNLLFGSLVRFKASEKLERRWNESPKV